MKIAELFAEIGIELDEKPLEKFSGLLKSTKGLMGLLTVGVIAGVAAIDKFTQKTIDGAASLRAFRIETGLSTNELQGLQTALQLTDIKATPEQISSSIQALESNIANIRLGLGDINAFNLAGIDVSPGKNALNVIDQIFSRREEILSFGRSTAGNLLDRMGLGKQFLNLLELSDKEFDKFKRTYILSSDQIDTLTEMGTAFKDLGLFIKFAKDGFVAFISPTLIAGAKTLKEIISFLLIPFRAVGGIISFVGDVMEKLGVSTKHILPTFESLKIVIIALAAVFAPAISGMLFFLLLLEDFFAALQGKDSVIFTIFDKIAEFGKKAFASISDSFKEMFSGVGDFFLEVFQPIADFIEKFINEPMREIVRAVADLPTPGDVIGSGIDIVGDAASDLGRSVSNTFSNVFNIVTDNPQAAADLVSNGMQEQFNIGLTDINNSGVQ